MSLKIAVVETQTPTSNGVVTYKTDNLGGIAPKLAIFVGNQAYSGDVNTFGNHFYFGATDGSREWCTSIACEDDVSTGDTSRARRLSCVNILDNDLQPSLGYANFDSWVSDGGDGETGIKLDWSGVDASFNPIGLSIILFAGDDIDVYTDVVDMTGILEDASKAVTDPGFTPTLVLGSMSWKGAFTTAHQSQDDAVASLGYAYNEGGGSEDQAGFLWYWESGLSTSNCRGKHRKDRFLFTPKNGQAFTRCEYDLDSFDANGFTIVPRGDDAESGDSIGYIAIKHKSGASGIWAGDVQPPTSTGNKSFEGPGFQPQTLLQILSMFQSQGSQVNNSNQASVIHCGVWDASPGNDVQHNTAFQTNVGTTDAEDDWYTNGLDLKDGDDVTTYEATGPTFDSDGWDFNFSTVQGTAVYWLAIAFTSVDAVDDEIKMINRGFNRGLNRSLPL